MKYNLYYFDSPDEMDLKKMSGISIVIIGNSLNYPALIYFVKDNEYLTENNIKKPGVYFPLTENEYKTIKSRRQGNGQVNLQVNLNPIGAHLLKKLDMVASDETNLYYQNVGLMLSSDCEIIDVSDRDPNGSIDPRLKDLIPGPHSSSELLRILKPLENADIDSLRCSGRVDTLRDGKMQLNFIYNMDIHVLIEKIERKELCQSNPDWKKFFDELIGFQKKVGEIERTARTNPSYRAAADQAGELFNTLKDNARIYSSSGTKEAYKTFKDKSLAAIKQTRPELEKHHDLKQIVGNIALAIIGIGIIYAAACGVNKLVTGHCLFFPSDSSKKLDKLVDIVNHIHETPNSTVTQRPK